LSKKKVKHIVFDHDGTLVDTSGYNRSLFPGMLDFLNELTEHGVKLYVWTARGRRSTVEILDFFDITEMFSDLSCGPEALSKPSPEGIRNMLGDVDPQSVAVIGDSIGDLVGGAEFGALCIGAMWGHTNTSASKVMLENGADFVCRDVNECRKIIKEYI
jgi:phosphoglycolate phosphatase